MVAWVTGAGRGIGAAIAKELAHAGSRVVLSSRHREELQQTAQDIVSRSGQAEIMVCDVTRNQEVQATVAGIRTLWGPVAILINNAGLAVFRKIIDTREEDWDAMMQANAKSAFLCSQAVLPDMIAGQSGHIINIVSVAGRQPFYNCGGYCAAKYALHGFTDVLRMETRKHGIRVTAVMPGATDTAIWGDAQVDRRRMMSPEEVARAVVAICDPNSPAMVEELVIRPQGGDL
jgi:short-subunit dehydrogenase